MQLLKLEHNRNQKEEGSNYIKSVEPLALSFENNGEKWKTTYRWKSKNQSDGFETLDAAVTWTPANQTCNGTICVEAKDRENKKELSRER